MNELLFDRAAGSLGPNAFARLETNRLLRSFRPAPHIRFDGGHKGLATSASFVEGSSSTLASQSQDGDVWAHQAGVNALALERFDGRMYATSSTLEISHLDADDVFLFSLVSGGTDATIKLWNLEQSGNPHAAHAHKPIATIDRAGPASSTGAAQHGHRYGITHLSFYPFDSEAFLSSSFDQTLKLWATHGAQMSGSWELGSKLYTHAVSPIADHLLVACGLAHPTVRLIDLRTNAAVQSLVAPGQITGGGAVFALAWSPRHEHVLASGHLDGAVRLWDIRRASALLGQLDQEDSLGTSAHGLGNGSGSGSAWARGSRLTAKAHSGPANGLAWTDDGAHVVSAGHDRRIRVWDAVTGANTLASFGPSIRNGQLARAPMLVSPTGLTPSSAELLFWPNETEILVMDLHDGSLVTRLRAPGAQAVAGVRTRDRPGERSVRNRITSLVWRGAGGHGRRVEGPVPGGTNAPGGLYSGHMEGVVRAWVPQSMGADDEDVWDGEDEARQGQKRKAINDALRAFRGGNITFT